MVSVDRGGLVRRAAPSISIRDGVKVTHQFLFVISNRSRLQEPPRAGAAKRPRRGLAGEGLGAEASPRHEGGHCEIDQVGHDRCLLATA